MSRRLLRILRLLTPFRQRSLLSLSPFSLRRKPPPLPRLCNPVAVDEQQQSSPAVAMALAARGCASVVVEKLRRVVRTAIFMVAMMFSLLASSLPVVLVAAGDVALPFALISTLVPSAAAHPHYGGGGIKYHVRHYSFRSSLIDFPLVSAFRSLIIICIYAVCDGPAMSHGPYMGAVSLCSMVSVIILSVKACVFTVVSSQFEAEVASSSHSNLLKHKHNLNKCWGMPVLFLSSVVFALGHVVVAYRNSYRARRKLMFHRVDPEAVLSCKNVFSGHQKVPRSPTPMAGRTPRTDSEMKRKGFGLTREDTCVPVMFLADIDSLFITCEGLMVHYKLCLPGSPPHQSLSSTAFLESNQRMALGRLKFVRQASGLFPNKQQHNLHRSYSNQFHGSSLCAPLLDSCPTSPVLSEDIPVLTLDDPVEEEEIVRVSSGSPLKQDMKENDQFGIVLVHGFGGGVFSWRHVMGELAQQVGCRVVAFDRPGWGLTSRPRRKDWEDKELPNPYMLNSQVDLLLSFCSEMGFSSVVLVGHDDGGLLALKATQRVKASMNPSNATISGVVLLNVSMSREVVPAFARILLRTTLGKKHLVRPLLRTEIIQVVNRRAWYDSTKLTAETLKLYKAPLYIEGWDEAVHEIGKLSCETVLSPQISVNLLKAVEDMPVLVVAGAEDVLVPLKSCQAMASKLVNSRLVAISSCGHLPHEECPTELLAAMTPFISRLLQEADLENQ